MTRRSPQLRCHLLVGILAEEGLRHQNDSRNRQSLGMMAVQQQVALGGGLKELPLARGAILLAMLDWRKTRGGRGRAVLEPW